MVSAVIPFRYGPYRSHASAAVERQRRSGCVRDDGDEEVAATHNDSAAARTGNMLSGSSRVLYQEVAMTMPSEPSRRDVLRAAGAVAAAATVAADAGVAAEPPATRSPAHLPHARPEEIGLDPKQLRVAYDLLAKWTTGENAPVPGGAVVVGRNGKIVPPRLFGRQGPEPDAPPIRDDAMFLLASITKPVVYLAGMMLVERGLLNLSDPVVRYVPEFRGPDKELVLVRHLFTHTSGLPDMLPDNLELRRKQVPVQRFLDGAVRDTVLAFKPGTQLSYQSTGTAVVAEIIQRLSGQTIAEFLRKEIFDPLGLKSTALGAKGFPRERLVRVRLPAEQVGTDWGWNSPYWQQLGAPWGGLFSTPEDLTVLCQLMLSKGTHAGVKLLSAASVRAMTTNRLAEFPELPEPVARCKPWGLGWRLNHPGTAGSWGDLLGKEVYGHSGATGTLLWIDPASQGFCILLTTLPSEVAPWRLVSLSNAIAAAFV
jgi:CubicO group peptidase (beta-lactamase class C family)